MRAVRQWALWLLQAHHKEWLATRPVSTFLRLVDHPESEVSNLGFDLLERATRLEEVPVEEWLLRLDGDDFEKSAGSPIYSRESSIRTDRPGQCIAVAAYRSKPVAEFGLRILMSTDLRRAGFSDLLRLGSGRKRSRATRIGRLAAVDAREDSANVSVDAGCLEFLDSRAPRRAGRRLGLAEQFAAR